MWTHKGGTGIWSEYVNEDTNESSLKEHRLKEVKQWCSKKNHKYIIKDMGKRLAVCSKCGQELVFIVSKHKINGNSVSL